MGKLGWLTIRKIPLLKSKESGSYNKVLQKFCKDHEVCSACKGRGFILKKKGKVVDETTVKFQGIEELEKLSTTENVSITDVIREILEREVWNRKRCKKCKGSRFVAREGVEDVRKKSVTKGKTGTRS